MDDRQLRRRCEVRLKELALPMPFDIHAFCETISEQRGRPIVLHAVPGTAGACGVWVPVPSADLIFYEEHTSPLHQEHIILHEISHLMCNHHPVPVSEHEISQLLFPDVHPETVKLVLQRGGYATEEEREAELLASLIRERVSAGSHGRRSRTGQDRVLNRLVASLDASNREVS